MKRRASKQASKASGLEANAEDDRPSPRALLEYERDHLKSVMDENGFDHRLWRQVEIARTKEGAITFIPSEDLKGLLQERDPVTDALWSQVIRAAALERVLSSPAVLAIDLAVMLTVDSDAAARSSQHVQDEVKKIKGHFAGKKKSGHIAKHRQLIKQMLGNSPEKAWANLKGVADGSVSLNLPENHPVKQLAGSLGITFDHRGDALVFCYDGKAVPMKLDSFKEAWRTLRK